MSNAVLSGAALLALALAASACGPRVAPEPLAAAEASAGPGTQEEAPVGTVADGATPAQPGTEPTAAPTASSASPSPRPSPSFGPAHNNGAVRIELSATCVSPGDLLVVTLRTPPKAGLGMVIGYSDNSPHGAMLTGESDSNGMYVWRVPIEPTVPDGAAKVLVTATGPNWQREGGGTADAAFRVARAGC